MIWLLIKIVRWLLGYVKFNVYGDFLERFVNFSIRDGISIWDITKINNGISGKVTASEYRNLRNTAKKCGCKIKLLSKYGLPFFTKKYRRRKGFIVGLLLFFVILYLLSSYVWSINVSGNSYISSEEVINVMKDLGVSAGSLKKRIDIPMVRQEAMIRLPNTSWISINLKGSYADVSIKEKVIAPSIIKEDKPCNIKAYIDGRIERMETYKGMPVVKDGDAVLKGQLLISGVVENNSGGNSFIHSEGKIFAHTKRNIKETVPLCQVKAIDTGKVIKRHRIKFFGIEIPFSLWYKTNDDYRYELYTNHVKIGNISLPIVFYHEDWYEQACSDVILTYEEALAEANKKICERETNELINKKILNKYLEDKEENGTCVLSATYDCLEDIGQKEEIIAN